MIGLVIVFLILALVAGGLGFTGVEFISLDIAKILFIVFIVLFVLSLIATLLNRRNMRPPL